MTWYAVPDDSHRETWAVANAQHRTSRLTDNDRSIAYGIASEADARRIAAALNYVDHAGRVIHADRQAIVEQYSAPWPSAEVEG